MLKLLLRGTIGIGTFIVGKYGIIAKKKKLVKYYWLSHYLIGNGNSLHLPSWLIEDSMDFDEDVIKRNNNSVVTAYNPDIYYCIGSYVVSYEEQSRSLHSTDIYDFHKNHDKGEYFWVNVIFISELVFKVIEQIILLLGITGKYSQLDGFSEYLLYNTIKISEFNNVISISDEFFKNVKGIPFITHIIMDYKKKENMSLFA